MSDARIIKAFGFIGGPHCGYVVTLDGSWFVVSIDPPSGLDCVEPVPNPNPPLVKVGHDEYSPAYPDGREADGKYTLAPSETGVLRFVWQPLSRR